MNKLVPFMFFALTLSLRAQDDKKGNLFTNVKDEAQMIIAKQKFYAGNYQGALSIYRELEKTSIDIPTIKYHIALCYYSLGQTDKAKETLLKSLEISKDVKPQTNLLLGKIYHKEAAIDKAIEQFQLSSNEGKSEDKQEAAKLLAQCLVAKTLMSKPLNVATFILNKPINSKYDDKNPCITADGRYLVFTTRRPESTEAPTDVEGDGKYFENIYISKTDSSTNQFITANTLGNNVNTPAHDACTSISPDGTQLFIYKNDIDNKASRGGNVFVSKQLGGKWKTPQSLGKPINTSANWEGGACVSPDGKRYFFTSERRGGFGGSDIWMVERKNKKTWEKPVNLGPAINTEYDEAGMFLAPDGKTLFFCSNNLNSMGSYDIFRSVYENGQWSPAVNLGYPINTTAKEGQLTISADARYAYLSSDRPGGYGESDIYRIELKDYAILEKDGQKKSSNGLSIVRGTIREGFEGYGMPEVEVFIKNESNGLTAQLTTNENGEYFTTIQSGKCNIQIKKKGYKEINENFEIPLNEKETQIIEKGYLLKK